MDKKLNIWVNRNGEEMAISPTRQEADLLRVLAQKVPGWTDTVKRGLPRAYGLRSMGARIRLEGLDTHRLQQEIFKWGAANGYTVDFQGTEVSLRSATLRIASGLPVGNPTRRKILAALREG